MITIFEKFCNICSFGHLCYVWIVGRRMLASVSWYLCSIWEISVAEGLIQIMSRSASGGLSESMLDAIQPIEADNL